MGSTSAISTRSCRCGVSCSSKYAARASESFSVPSCERWSVTHTHTHTHTHAAHPSQVGRKLQRTVTHSLHSVSSLAAHTAARVEGSVAQHPRRTLCGRARSHSDSRVCQAMERCERLLGGEDQGAEDAFMGQKKPKNHHILASFGKRAASRASGSLSFSASRTWDQTDQSRGTHSKHPPAARRSPA